MKKKLLTLAVAAALPMATQAANAEVTIYGKIHASIDYVSYDDDKIVPGGDTDSQWDVTSRASRLGFKGSEDLGDGLKLIWKLESGIDVSGGSGGLSARNRYIGLAGGWADYNLSGAGFVDIRAKDAIAYVSPSFAGLTLVGAIVPDGDYDGDGDFAGGYSLAAMYSNGGLFLAGAYENVDDLFGGADLTHWRIGAGFDMGAFHIGGVYADQDDFTGGAVYTINGSWTFGNNVLKAMWERSEDMIALGGDDSDTWAIGLDHNFSKRSKAGFSMGMVHKF